MVWYKGHFLLDFVVCFDVNHTGWKLETKVKETAPKLKQPAFVLIPGTCPIDRNTDYQSFFCCFKAKKAMRQRQKYNLTKIQVYMIIVEE